MKKLMLLFIAVIMLLLGGHYTYGRTTVPGLPGSDRFFPDLLITEISANPSKGNSRGEGYEFIELYNNTDRSLNIKDYNIRCHIPDGTFVQWDITENRRISPKQAVVIWVKNSDSYKDKGELTHSDFNRHYHSSLSKEQVVSAEASGMSNIHDRTISVTTDTGNTIVTASYLAGAYSPVTPNGSSILYDFPMDGSTSMVKRGISDEPGPGRVSKGQVPEQPNHIVDQMRPSVMPIKLKTEIPERTDLPISFQIEDDRFIQRATIYFKRHQDRTFTEANLSSTEINNFSYVVSRFDLFASNPTFDYYLEVSDGYHMIKYPEDGNLSIVVGNPSTYKPFKKGISLTNDTILSGKKYIEVHKKEARDKVRLYRDDSLLQTKAVLSRPPTLVFEANNIKEGYKNALFAGKRQIKILEPTHGSFSPFEIMIPLSNIKQGKNVLTVRSGSRHKSYVKNSPIFKNQLNDFEMKNVKLLLGDGTIIRPKEVIADYGDGKEVKEMYRDQRIYTLGHGNPRLRSNQSTKASLRRFVFQVPSEKFLTERAVVYTSDFADGRYNVKAVINGSEQYEANPKFDNTAPEISIKSLAEGQTYKGTFTIDAESIDRVSKWSSLQAALDGKRIKLPYTTSSGKLKRGKHSVIFTASDAVGNVSRKTLHFQVVNEDPIIKDTVFPRNNSSDVPLDSNLSVKVNDPTRDNVNAIFYRADRYDYTKKGHIKGFSNIADREPPLELEAAGEAELRELEGSKLSKLDHNYLLTKSNHGFPYQRFDIPIDDHISKVSEAELEWTGHSYSGRRVTMYAWNHKRYKWEALAYGYGDKDFTLKAVLDKNKYIKDQKVQVLIQDLPEAVNQNFTLIWMSDTQYYSSTFPFIFPIMTNWAKTQYDKGNAGYVIHTGDIVDFRWDLNQWDVASKSMAALDGGMVPYGVTPGNHDAGSIFIDYKNYQKYFGRGRFTSQPSYGGDLNDNIHHYDLVSFGGHDFIILYLGWGSETDNSTIKWANSVLKKYSDRNAILATHAYLDIDGKRTAKGQTMFNKLVKPNQNVKIVLSGHFFGASRNVEEIPAGKGKVRRVIEMLADYQGGPEGGQGYMRLLQFDPANKQLRVKTYSPYLDHYNFFDSGTDEFTLSKVELIPMHKQVATDYLSLNVYTNDKIGMDENVKSSRKAEIPIKGLKPSMDYYWYVEVSDKYGGKAKSPIWKFTTDK
ncbi:lamin tail domain-containing protein [Peribacillus deserti]|uniref:lamin tail domain-containing protein n=1 Tax=Peribacillus deserti TaxID=673318 RepID=UPI0015E10D84|nr:lamin tail domain-containing protein [Peribacillus deserti]